MGYVPPPNHDPGLSTAENARVFFAWCDGRTRLHAFQAIALVAGFLGLIIIVAALAARGG